MENLLENIVEGLLGGQFKYLEDEYISSQNIKNVFIGEDITNKLIVVFNFPFDDDRHAIYIKDAIENDFLCISDKMFYLYIINYMNKTDVTVKLFNHNNLFLVKVYLGDYEFNLSNDLKNSPEYALLVNAWFFMHTYHHYEFSKTNAAKKARSFVNFLREYICQDKWQYNL